MTERWKQIEEFPNYEVSDCGRVRRQAKKEMIYLGGSKHKQGYQAFFLTNDVGEFGRLGHRLVALAFVENPNNKPNVCHRDGNPQNNNWWNLRWDDQTGNLADTLEHGTGLHGERAYFAKLTEAEVIWIKETYAQDKYHGCIKDIAECIGHPYTRVRDVLRGKTWMHIKLPTGEQNK